MQKVHVDAILKKMDNGCTEPYFAKLSDKEQEFYAVIKLKNNEQGILSLINELISYQLAISLNVKMPLSGIALIDDNTDICCGLDASCYGNCFYSYFIKSASIINENIMKFVSNKDSYEKIILFDHLIYNTDRNKGNLLISINKGDKILYAIDHTHVFKNQTIWDGLCLNQGIKENDYKDLKIMKDNDYSYFFNSKKITLKTLLDQADVFKQTIDKDLLGSIIACIPFDWEINKKDLLVLVKYLLYRTSCLDEICQLIINYYE